MRILLITAHFPPEQSGGGARPHSLYKYLPKFGVEVTVLTKRLSSETKSDEHIIRADSIIDWRTSSWLSRKRLQRYWSFIGYKFFHGFTDSYWIRSCMRTVHELFKKQKFDLVYATYPSAEALRIGELVKRKYHIPFVAEFRDGMVFERNIKTDNPAHIRFLTRLEMEIIRNADSVITIGEVLSDYFRNKYKKTIHTVYNGFDPDDFIGLPEPNIHANKTRIVHFGSMNFSRVTKREGLFYAMKELKEAGKINKENFELVFIGNFYNEEKEIIYKLDIADLVKFRPSMSKQLGFEMIRNEFNYLLFYGAEGDSSVISTKVPEYLKLGLPILGICKGNEAEVIIERTGTGEVSDFDVEAICKLIERTHKGGVQYLPNHNQIEKFNRLNQAQEIATILKEVCSKG